MSNALSVSEIEERIKNTFKQNVSLISPYKNRRSLIILKCNDCGHEWSAIASSVLYRDNHECPNCGEHANKKIKLFCANCGKEIYRVPSQVDRNKSGFFYCSIECGNIHKNRLREESGEWDDSQSYRKKAFGVYEHKCCICGWDEDERILEVHHKDEDRSHNQVSNLCIICPTCHRKITLGYYKLSVDFKLIPN